MKSRRFTLPEIEKKIWPVARKKKEEDDAEDEEDEEEEERSNLMES